MENRRLWCLRLMQYCCNFELFFSSFKNPSLYYAPFLVGCTTLLGHSRQTSSKIESSRKRFFHFELCTGIFWADLAHCVDARYFCLLRETQIVRLLEDANLVVKRICYASRRPWMLRSWMNAAAALLPTTHFLRMLKNEFSLWWGTT